MRLSPGPLGSLAARLAAAALLLAPATAAQYAYNVTVSDVSPAMRFTPSRAGPAATTWNDTWSESAWSKWANNTLGQGESAHTTTAANAAVAVSWQGTAVWFVGQSNGSFALDIDGASHGQVWSVTGLSNDWHTATITLTSGPLTITGATMLHEIGSGDGLALNFETLNSTNAGGTGTSTWVNMAQCIKCGDNTGFAGGGGVAAGVYNRVQTNGPYDQISFTAPSNVSFMYIYGSVNFDHSDFAVSLSPQVSDVPTPANQTFNGLSSWAASGRILYFTALDPTATYTITIENLGEAWQYFDFGSVAYGTLTSSVTNVTSAGGTSASASSATTSGTAAAQPTSPSSDSAAIVGGVVGGLAGLAILAALAFFLYRRRQRRDPQPAARYYEERAPFEIDVDAEPKMTPYYDSPNAAYASAAAGSPYSVSQGGSPDLSSGSAGVALLPAGASSADPFAPHGTHSGSYTSLTSGTTPTLDPLQTPPRDETRASVSSSRPGRLALATLAPGDHEAAADGAAAAAAATATKARGARRSSAPGFRQETDAGPVPAPPGAAPTAEEIVPPSYDPAWADEGRHSGVSITEPAAHGGPPSPAA